jgi:hypothetical protein
MYIIDDVSLLNKNMIQGYLLTDEEQGEIDIEEYQ